MKDVIKRKRKCVLRVVMCTSLIRITVATGWPFTSQIKACAM